MSRMKAAASRVALLLLIPLLASTPGWGDSKVTASATCSDYSNHADAQRAKDTRDADGDGIYCESLPCPCLKPGSGGGGGGGGGGDGSKDRTCARPRRTVTVELRSRYPEATLHFEVAWKQGAPRRYTIARSRAERNRDAWGRFVPVGVDADRNGQTDDRDEVPMAFTREGSRKART